MPTDFVYDGTSLPDGKSDLRPLTAAASKSITATEWNTAMAAIADLRAAILAGDYHGLATNPSAEVSAATAVRLRSKAGVLQASENGGAYRSVMGAELHARDYGVVADGTTNDVVALQAAVDAAIALQRPLRLAKGVHLLNSRLNLGGTITILGTARDGGGGGTVIKAGAAMNQLVYGSACSFSSVSGVEFDGNGLANVALQLGNCSLSVFDRCRFTGALYDGVRVPRYLIDGVTFGLSDSNHFLNCDGYRNGMLFAVSALASDFAGLNVRTTVVTGTMSCTAGSNVVTGVGTTFTAMGLRRGDFVRIGTGGTPEYLQVDTVDSDTQITCGLKQLATQTLSAQGYMIGRGAGYFEEFGPDTNINHITGGIWRSNAACGIQIGGLYGALVDHVQVDTHPLYGIAVNFSAEDTQTYATVIQHPYLEGNEAAPFYLGAAYGITIIQPMVLDIAVPIHYSSTTFNVGTWMDFSGITAIGGGTSRMPSTRGYDFKNVGKSTQGIGGVSTGDPASTILYDSALLQLPTGGIVAYTSTPTLANGTEYGQHVTFYAIGAGGATFDDYRKRTGTGLMLKTPSVTLRGGDAITLMWDEVHWVEISRSVAPVAGDSTASPGSATVNELQGRSAIAAAASTCTITNHQVAAGDVVMVTLEDLDATATRLKVAVAAGSFTVTANAAATATTKFAWKLVKE